ncbi:MAG TPA: hypothetical protein VHN77_01415 [Phycisphaerales bacterium]|nr:hypothetical protein [Phycisphaerales bacterium]
MNLPVIAALVCLCAVWTLPAKAQQGDVPDETPAEVRDEAVASYLADMDLLDVLAAHLRERVEHAPSPAREQAAEGLGKLYVKLLGRAKTREERTTLEAQARALLDRVPTADNPELRIDLAKASYLSAEETAERFRLRLAKDEDVVEALRVLRAVGPLFTSIGSRLHERVTTLERKEETVGDDEALLVRAQLAEARRLRSLARYYDGWANYYTALLSDHKADAQQALVAFGVLLNAPPGKPATLDRMPKNLLRFEHVSRSAMGCALAASLAGDDVAALRWMEALESSTELPAGVEDQLFSRRIIVLLAADRWSDAISAVRERRTAQGGGVAMLTTPEARLLAVQTLEALRREDLRAGFREPANELAQAALADLIGRGEVSQVVDLVKKYGTLPIGRGGFIVAYVRAIESFEETRGQHKAGLAAGASADDPAKDPAVVNAYRDAAKLLADAAATKDAATFPDQLGQALLRRGLALYYAGDMTAAADAFEEAFGRARAGSMQQDALWFAVVALDGAIEGGTTGLADRRKRLATLFLRSFPGSENATRLLLRGDEGIGEAEAIDILMKVSPESHLHTAARRQASRLLYAAYKRAGAGERDFAAMRFADVAEEVIRADFATAMKGDGEAAKESAQSVIIRARQLADAILSQRVPDLPRVEAALDLIGQVASRTGTPVDAFKDELAFRRLQIALAREDDVKVTEIAAAFQGSSGPFAVAADRLLFQRGVDRWRVDESDLKLARDVVRFGSRIIDASANPRAQGLDYVRDQTAKAAALLWDKERSDQMRALAIRVDRAQIESGVRTVSTLRRLAQMLEDAGDTAGAQRAWDELVDGFDEGTEPWLEARYNSLRLLIMVDAVAASSVYDQHMLLNPGGGEEPWGPKIEALKDQLPSRPAPPAGKGGGG